MTHDYQSLTLPNCACPEACAMNNACVGGCGRAEEGGYAALIREIDRLEKLVYVPGVWACPKCKFQLIQSNLNASDGSVTARDTPGEKCPNCATPLWRTSYRDEYKHWAEGYEALLIERTLPAESRLHALSVLPSAPAWRAIETAPRDQTIVVAGDFEHDPLFGIATWHGEGWMLWWDCAKDGDGGTHHWPTHWMPLPSSPVSGGEEE